MESCETARDAIIDSGASCTFVTADVELGDSRPGEGSVSCANGQKEEIAEVGSFGPLRRAQKVLSFPRSLISVMDLVEQFGEVCFNADGALLQTECDVGKLLVSTIGKATEERLFSFDLEALQRHADRLVQIRAEIAEERSAERDRAESFFG